MFDLVALNSWLLNATIFLAFWKIEYYGAGSKSSAISYQKFKIMPRDKVLIKKRKEKYSKIVFQYLSYEPLCKLFLVGSYVLMYCGIGKKNILYTEFTAHCSYTWYSRSEARRPYCFTLMARYKY